MLNSNDIFEFDDVRVEVSNHSVLRGGTPLKLPPRVFQTLVILLEASPRMVPKSVLTQALWPDTVVDESGLAQNIHLLRKALGRRPSGDEYVETVPKHGYRLAAEIRQHAAPVQLSETRHPDPSDLPPAPRRSRWWPVALSLPALLLAALAWTALGPTFARKSGRPEAVRLVEMGREVWKNTARATPHAEEQFRQAIQLDPGYAPAYVGLAFIEATSDEGAKRAESLLAQALRIDPNSSDAHATAAFVAMIHRWDWVRARGEFERAIALDPRNTVARRWYSLYLSLRGEYAAAAEQIRAALAIEPSSAHLLTQQCVQLAYEDHLDEALAWCQSALEVQPRFQRSHACMFQIYGTLGNAELAARHLVLAGEPENLAAVLDLAPRLELVARTRGLAGVLEDHVHSANPYARAEAFAMLHDRDQALANLRETVAQHGFFSAFIRAEPMFHFLYGDREFENLLERVGLPPSGRLVR